MSPLYLLILVPSVLAAIAYAVNDNEKRPWILPPAAAFHAALTAALLCFDPGPALGGALALDAPGRIVLGLLSALFLGASLYAAGYLQRRRERDNRTFTACLLAFLAATTLAALSLHFGLLWVAVEGTTLAAAPLLYFNHNARSLEATWKYLVIGSVGIALALLGTFFLGMAETAGGPVPDALLLPAILSRGASLSVPWLKIAVVFLVVGYGTKMGLAPLHTWKPDAYGEAPGLAGFLLAGISTSCAFLALMRVLSVCEAAGQADFARPLFVLMGLLSMGVAAVFMLGQKDYKRMLAYSSVEHMGILFIGLGLGGLAVYGALLHMVNNGLAKGVMFLTAANIHRRYGTKSAAQVQGLFREMPLSGGLWMAGFLAVTATPPFGLFISEFTILRAAVLGQRWGVVALFLVFMAAVFAGMGRVILSMAQGEPAREDALPGPGDSFLTTLTPCALLAATLVLGVYIPPWLDRAIEAAAGRLP